jgi:hypothetical protein
LGEGEGASGGVHGVGAGDGVVGLVSRAIIIHRAQIALWRVTSENVDLIYTQKLLIINHI